MDALRDMSLFVEVASSGNFRRAAERLQMPVSTLSRRVALLERRLGVKLLMRTTRSVNLTSAGAVYLQRCKSIVAQAQSANADLQVLVTVPQGSLRISMTGDFGTDIFAPYLVEFRKRNPQISFDLDLSARRVDLLTEPFDLALRIGEIEPSALVARRLAMLRMALYASPEYLRKNGTPKKPEDLAGHATIPTVCGVENAQWILSNGKIERRVRLASPFMANNMGMVRRLILLSCGIGVVDEGMARVEVGARRLVRVLPQWSFDAVPVHVLMATRAVPAKTRVFVDFLAQEMKDIYGPGN